MAIQRVTPAAGDFQTALGQYAQATFDAGTFVLPVSAAVGEMQAFDDEVNLNGFPSARNAMTQPTSNSYWMPVTPNAWSFWIDWAQTATAGAAEAINQEELARLVLVHQFETAEIEVSGPYDDQISNVIALADADALELEVLILEIDQDSGGNTLLHAERSWGTNLTRRDPNVYYRRSDVLGEVYEYPGTNVHPFSFQIAAPLQSLEQLALYRLVLPGGATVESLQGAVGSDRVTCMLPNTQDGAMILQNVVSGALAEFAGPNGPKLSANLLFEYID